ncbi:MAG: hypothetical protein ACK5B6_05175 [Bacteroidia bacterium]|jgi:hypothetical protein
MKTLQIKSVFLLLTLAALLALPLQATIEKVKLQAGSIASAQNLSNEMQILNSNSNNSSQLGMVNGFDRLPFVININHIVTLTGDWLNTCDRVEILNSAGSIVQTLRDAALTKSTVSGKGQLKFTVPSTRLTSVANFEIRVRYLAEINGFDVLKCRVVNRGVINSITWTGTNLPTITNVTGGERSTLTREVEYKLQFTGTDLGTALSLTDTPNGINLGVTSTVVNSTGTIITITMKPPFVSNAVVVNPDLQDFVNDKNFEIIGVSGKNSNPFGAYLMYDFNNTLSTTGNLTNLAQLAVTPPPPTPDLKPLAPSSFGTTYSFGTSTVTDQQGKIYKNIITPVDTTGILSDLGEQLKFNGLLGNSSRTVSKVIGNDATLGTITLHQITMGTYTCPISNNGTGNATTTFTNSFRGNMVASTAQVLPSQAALTRATTFPSVSTVTQTLPSLNQGITNNSIVNKRMIQVFTFSNRPGSFYCDNAWPAERGNTVNSLITITVDTNNNINEGTEGGESNNVFPN